MMGSSRKFQTCFSIILLLIRNGNSVVERTHSVLGMNKGLETCSKENAICGFLQANQNGINQQRLCECPGDGIGGGSTCSVVWDSEDGKSITQGSEQYKFCGKPPTLSVCETNQPAYTGRLVYSKRTMKKVSSLDEMHCLCPESHNYVLTHQKWNPVPSFHTEVVEFSYICAPLPTCNVGDVCKTVTETGTEHLVNQKCVCPKGFSCPSEGNLGLKSFQTTEGRVDFLRCQL